jgi:hypothetical protein
VASISARRVVGGIDACVLLYSMILEYNNGLEMTNERTSERASEHVLLQHIVNVELIQPVHYQRNNGSKTRIMTPYTTT